MVRENPYWIKKKIVKTAISTKNRCYKTAKRTKSDDDWLKFKRAKRDCRRLIVSAKGNFIKEKLSCQKEDLEKFWQKLGRNFDIGKRKDRSACNAVKGEVGEILHGKFRCRILYYYGRKTV